MLRKATVAVEIGSWGETISPGGSGGIIADSFIKV